MRRYPLASKCLHQVRSCSPHFPWQLLPADFPHVMPSVVLTLGPCADAPKGTFRLLSDVGGAGNTFDEADVCNTGNQVRHHDCFKAQAMHYVHMVVYHLQDMFVL